MADFIKFKQLYGIGKVTKVATYFKYMQTVMFETVVHGDDKGNVFTCLLYTSPSPRDRG